MQIAHLNILRDAGHDSADFLSLDVQGAEYRVLQASRPAAFKVIMTETYSLSRFDRKRELAGRAPVGSLLTEAGLVKVTPPRMGVYGSHIYVRPEVAIVPVRSYAAGLLLKDKFPQTTMCGSKFTTLQLLKERMDALESGSKVRFIKGRG